MKDPFHNQECQFGDPNCWVAKGKCGKMSCVYCIVGNTCNEEIDPQVRQDIQQPGGIKASHYIGMTATSLHNRQLDHRKGHEKNKPNNPMVKHDIECHQGNKQTYTSKFIGEDRGLLPLSMKEAIMIEKQHAGTSMNDKLERGRGTGIVRIQASVT